MDAKRRNELILISQRVHDYADQQLKEYLEKTYTSAGPDSMGEQLEGEPLTTRSAGKFVRGEVIRKGESSPVGSCDY